MFFELKIDHKIVSEQLGEFGYTLFWECPNEPQSGFSKMWQCMKNYHGKPLGDNGVYACQIYRIPAKKYNDETVEWHLDTYDWINDPWEYSFD